MASAGEFSIQGCAMRISRLNSDGSISAASATAMVVDNKPFMKLTAKPVNEAGIEIVLKSACGDLLGAYKDFDRAKRWDITLDLGDLDFDKREIVGGGSLLTAASSSGRTFADGATTLNDIHLSSPSLAAFLPTDVGRSVTGTGIPASTYITLYISATSVVMNNAATATASGLSIVLGAIASRTIGYAFPALLSVPNQNGIAIEIWTKAMVRGTGYQGTTPYPSVGSLSAPALTGSAYFRWGVFRYLPLPDGFTIEDKENPGMFTGWAIENPNFGLGPMKDWTVTGAAGGVAIDTTKWCNVMMDFQLPTPLQPGYQTTAA